MVILKLFKCITVYFKISFNISEDEEGSPGCPVSLCRVGKCLNRELYSECNGVCARPSYSTASLVLSVEESSATMWCDGLKLNNDQSFVSSSLPSLSGFKQFILPSVNCQNSLSLESRMSTAFKPKSTLQKPFFMFWCLLKFKTSSKKTIWSKLSKMFKEPFQQVNVSLTTK